MYALSRNLLNFAAAAALAVPVALLAAEKPVEAPAGHHPEQGQTAPASANSTQSMPAQRQARMQAMQTRMQAMQATSDPQARMSMMMAQMQDMQTMMKDMGTGCPMANEQGGMGMMGGGRAGMMGNGMHGGMGMGGPMVTPNSPSAPAKPGAK